MFLPNEINREELNRPSGVVPMQTRARKSWVSAMPESIAAKLKKLSPEIKFSLYDELDKDVLEKFKELLKNNKGHAKIDTDETMIEAGQLVASLVVAENRIK